MGVEYPTECVQKSVYPGVGTSVMGVEYPTECVQKSVLSRSGTSAMGVEHYGMHAEVCLVQGWPVLTVPE